MSIHSFKALSYQITCCERMIPLMDQSQVFNISAFYIMVCIAIQVLEPTNLDSTSASLHYPSRILFHVFFFRKPSRILFMSCLTSLAIKNNCCHCSSPMQLKYLVHVFCLVCQQPTTIFFMCCPFSFRIQICVHILLFPISHLEPCSCPACYLFHCLLLFICHPSCIFLCVQEMTKDLTHFARQTPCHLDISKFIILNYRSNLKLVGIKAGNPHDF